MADINPMAVYNQPQIDYDGDGIPDSPEGDSEGGLAKQGQIRLGELKTLGGYVFQYGPNGWYNTGVQDKAAGGGGLSFDEQMTLKRTPSSSSSSSTSQSFQDPAALALQRQQLDEQIRQHDLEIAQQKQVFEYQKTKDAFARSQDDKKLALQAQEMAATAQSRLQALDLQKATLVQQRETENARMQMQAQEANARNALQARQMDMQAETARQGQLAETNRDVAKFSQNPTDYGALAAFQLANRGWGQANTAQTDANLMTDESLQPLAGALQQREGLMMPRAGTNPGQIVAPQMGAMDMGQVGQTADQIMSQAKAGGFATPEGYTGSGQGLLEQADLYNKRMARGEIQPQADPRAAANANMEKQGVPSFVPRFEDGGASIDDDTMLMMIAKLLGMEPKAIAGEKGKANGETVMSNGDVVVIPDKGKAALPEMAAGGGVFDLNSFKPQYDTTQARQFQGDAFNKAVSGTPYARGGLGGLPTSVYASSPGFNPLVAQLLGSLNAVGKGIPQEEYMRQAQMLRPTAMNERVTGRSA